MKTEEQMRQLLREACDKAGSQRAFALANGVSAQYVGAVLMGDKVMSEKIGKALGYQKDKGWVKRKPK
jgi:hypothetical protein